MMIDGIKSKIIRSGGQLATEMQQKGSDSSSLKGFCQCLNICGIRLYVIITHCHNYVVHWAAAKPVTVEGKIEIVKNQNLQ